MIRPYRPGDLWLILPHIRQVELDECMALGEDPETCLTKSIYEGETFTGEIQGEVIGIAGLVPCGDFYSPWSVFTNAIEKHPKQFLTFCKQWINRYDVPMLNVVDQRFVSAQRWLQHLGFTLGETIPLGIHGEPFIVYRKNFVGAH